MTLEGKTLFISGGSRGIGLAIALRAARDGANVALIAKTAEPHPKLEGTVYTAAAQIEAAGGRALPVVGDIRDEAQVQAAVEAAVERFGGIDVCVNNASAINLSGTEALEIKRYDLMQSINARGTFVVSRACIPHLKRAANPHILTLSPPVSLEPRWLGPHIGYTIAKYGMTLCALGFAAEFAGDGIASNALWPRTLIATGRGNTFRELAGTTGPVHPAGPGIPTPASRSPLWQRHRWNIAAAMATPMFHRCCSPGPVEFSVIAHCL
jgi:citronellol/citronellal dehydrogenase